MKKLGKTICRHPYRASVIVLFLFFSAATLDTFGFLTSDRDERYIKRHFRFYQVKKFLHLSERDAPAFHRVTETFLGENWNRKYCVAAHKTRLDYEERMVRRTIQMKNRTPSQPDLEPLWNDLELPTFSRFSVRSGRKVQIVVLPRDWPAVEKLLTEYDQP